MHTKPISTEVIASSEATLISGFAQIRFDTETWKFDFDENDTSDLLRPFRQKTFDVLNGEATYTSAIEMFLNLPETNGDAKEHAHMHTVFQAAVAYPYIRGNFPLTTHMADNLKFHMKESLPDEIRPKLIEYFKKVDETLEFEEDKWLLDDHAVINNIAECSVFKNAKKLKGFPHDLLPHDGSDPEKKNIFQKTYDTIISKPHSAVYQQGPSHHQQMRLELLPALYIIGKVQADETRPMEEEEVKELITDLSAARLFYRTLIVAEQSNLKKKLSETPINVKTYQSIADALEAAIISVELPTDLVALKNISDDLTEDSLIDRPIFDYLFDFHGAYKCFEAISACSHFVANIDAVQRRKYVAQANDLIVFCNAIPRQGRSEEQKNLLLMMERLF